jgi:four helix bundle suffix protein
LRQRGVPVWDKAHPVILRFREAKVADIAQFRAFLSGLSDGSGTSGLGRSALVAQLLISLVNQSCLLLDRQLARLAADFENNGGFSERLATVRRSVRSFSGRDSK